MTTTRLDRAEINRLNAQKSTGPKTPEGKARSRFNALKHGLAAKTLVLPGEDPEVFQHRIEAWTDDLKPENNIEQYLVERAAAASWQIDRADRADTARLASIIRNEPAEMAQYQEGEAAGLGRRLFLDSYEELRGAVLEGPASPFSHSGGPGSPNHPAAIVFQLEATAAGRHWLFDRWAELRATLEQQQDLPLHDRLKVFRLLGKASLDAPGDADVAAVMPIGARRQAMGEQLEEMEPPDVTLVDDDPPLDDEPSADEGIGEPTPEQVAVERERLRAIVARSIARLEALARADRERAEADAAEQAARLSFDDSTEAERLRRYQFGCNRVLFRTLDTLLKLRRAAPSVGGKRGVGVGMREGQGSGRPSPAEAEPVAQTYTPILFVEDDVPAPAPRRRLIAEIDPKRPLPSSLVSGPWSVVATPRPLPSSPRPAPSKPVLIQRITVN